MAPYPTFTKLGLSRSQLEQVRTPLSGFTGNSIETEGSITLPVEVDTSLHTKKWEAEFVIDRLNCAHKIILGRPALEDLRCVISMEHLCVMFPTPSGVEVAWRDQIVSRSCYLRACRQKRRRDLRVQSITERALREKAGRPRAEPAVETENVVLDVNCPYRVVRIGLG